MASNHNKSGFEVRTLTDSNDGTEIKVLVPSAQLPSEEHAEVLRFLYNHHVTFPKTPSNPDGHWKGEAIAVVPSGLTSLVSEAMNFMGSLVDTSKPFDKVEEYTGLVSKWVELRSKGYWHHIGS